jgi:hypothetical protein
MCRIGAKTADGQPGRKTNPPHGDANSEPNLRPIGLLLQLRLELVHCLQVASAKV